MRTACVVLLGTALAAGWTAAADEGMGADLMVKVLGTICTTACCFLIIDAVTGRLGWKDEGDAPCASLLRAAKRPSTALALLDLLLGKSHVNKTMRGKYKDIQ